MDRDRVRLSLGLGLRLGALPSLHPNLSPHQLLTPTFTPTSYAGKFAGQCHYLGCERRCPPLSISPYTSTTSPPYLPTSRLHLAHISPTSRPHLPRYEGRCPPPTNFDSNYCYALGLTAAALVGCGCTGMMAAVRGDIGGI